MAGQSRCKLEIAHMHLQVICLANHASVTPLAMTG
jgi:hypothetical protein